tara:strand:+ start:144 stop:542 length:399 start_codon:yes stop_codon:yes gene_type:complete
MSYMSVTGPCRTATQHAGVEAKVSVVYSYDPQTNGGVAQIVATPADGRKIKLLSYTWSGKAAGATANFCSSAAVVGTAGTTLTGDLSSITSVAPFFNAGDNLQGIGTCVVNEDLCVSGAQGGAGTVVYSLVP